MPSPRAALNIIKPYLQRNRGGPEQAQQKATSSEGPSRVFVARETEGQTTELRSLGTGVPVGAFLELVPNEADDINTAQEEPSNQDASALTADQNNQSFVEDDAASESNAPPPSYEEAMSEHLRQSTISDPSSTSRPRGGAAAGIRTAHGAYTHTGAVDHTRQSGPNTINHSDTNGNNVRSTTLFGPNNGDFRYGLVDVDDEPPDHVTTSFSGANYGIMGGNITFGANNRGIQIARTNTNLRSNSGRSRNVHGTTTFGRKQYWDPGGQRDDYQQRNHPGWTCDYV